MALVVKDRVRETTTSTGTTAITLNGAVSGFQSFSVIGDGNTTYYTIVDAGTGAWEVGIGTYSSIGTQLTRDTVLESSSGGALINFGTGTKDVFVTYPAERSVYTDAAGSAITPATASILGVPFGGTGASTASAARQNLDLEIGVDVQAYDAGLQSISGLTTAANKMIYTTASDTYAVTDLTSAGRALLDDADAAAQRTTLGLGTIATQAANNVNIDGGTIDGTPIGGITPAAGSFTTLSATSLVVAKSVSWTQSTDTYSGGGVTDVHKNMRRCVLRDNGQVNYYLSETDSTKKVDGSAANLTGADGQVMVEIPAFYVKFTPGATRTWSISLLPADGYSLHPAFIKNGAFVPYRYYGAYDACVFNGSVYESGLNYDNNWTAGQNWNADGAAAKLASVSGVYPAVGITRANARTLAANRGAGWRQVDVYLEWAIELLFLVEFGTFRTQQTIGDGNTSVTNAYAAASSGNQTDSPHSVAGKSNALGNASTNTTNGASSGTRDTAYMSYRGIENWYGNCWNWVDGYNINNNQAYVSNNNTHFADDTATNYNAIGAAMVASDGWVTNCQNEPFAFLPSAVGGSSSTYWADYYYQAAGWRVALFGGAAGGGADAGGFYWSLLNGSSDLNRDVGARLAF